jgi:hypothetical protein
VTEGLIGVDTRPHPGPLPQERGNRSPVADGSEMTGTRAPLGANGREAVTATATTKLSSNARSFPLSLGERVGVRADVITNFPRSRITFHVSHH